MRTARLARSILGLALAALCAGCGDDAVGRGGVLPDVSAARDAAPDFSLIDQAGRPLALSDLRGKAVVLEFIYTHCPGPCPILTGTHVALQRSLPPDLREATHFVSITIDPARDDAEALRAYARARGVDESDWSLLGGEPEAVEPVARAYGVALLPESGGEMGHPLATYLIDPEGRIAQRHLGSGPEPDALRRELAEIAR